MEHKIVQISLFSEKENCPVCSVEFDVFGDGRNIQELKDVFAFHLLNHFENKFPKTTCDNHTSQRKKISGRWDCPVPDCKLSFATELIGHIGSHKISHVKDSPDLFS